MSPSQLTEEGEVVSAGVTMLPQASMAAGNDIRLPLSPAGLASPGQLTVASPSVLLNVKAGMLMW